MPFQTILPPEAYEDSSTIETFECINCVHGMLEGRYDRAGNFIVERLISTDPSAYLDARFAPSSVIKMPATK